ncbi:MAG: proline--tRNA ligase [Bacillota bacterium]
MKISKLVGVRLRENPADITIASHALMARAGYMKGVASGIYTLLPPAKRVQLKIEKIIREEMDGIGAQEVLFPVVMPRELWEESGRYGAIGSELARFKDRGEKDMLLGMTHEEAAVHMVRNIVTSYNQLPSSVYQIQTKFRDEPRARAGLIRVREFTMKDAYSFHTSQECLEETYDEYYKAYDRVFKRIGMKNFIAVKSDTGMMGGSVAHEFMLLTEIGEDTIVICDECGYKANMEVAVSTYPDFDYGADAEMKEVFTAEAHDINEVCEYLGTPTEHAMKAVSYAIKGDNERLVLAFIRGNFEINESKLKKVIGEDIVPADLTDGSLCAGNIGPFGLDEKKIVIVYDESLKGAHNMSCGANKPEYHITGVNVERDLKVSKFFDLKKVEEGEICPVCGKPLGLHNGIEVGNIFQLGTKYTKSMGMTVLDENGKAITPIMGCYGIGVGRAMASVVEESHDDKGIIWPMSIAPWQVFLANIKPNDESVKAESDKLYAELIKAGVEVLFDDRKQSPGVKFKDGELLGLPIRVVVSPRSLEAGCAEITMRDGSCEPFSVPVSEVVSKCKEIIAEKMLELQA